MDNANKHIDKIDAQEKYMAHRWKESMVCLGNHPIQVGSIYNGPGPEI